MNDGEAEDSHVVRWMFITACLALALAVVVFVSTRVQNTIVLHLPKPTGAWSVGTRIVSFPLDESPKKRVAATQIWYPTATRGGVRAPYAYGTLMGLRDRLLYKLVRTSATLDARVASGKWPVIIYLPGIGGNRAKNTTLSQELASHGYIVIAMDDTRPSGGFDFSTKELTQESIRWGDRAVTLRSHDVRRTVDALEVVNRDRASPFSGTMDLERIGVAGFSFGGAVAAESAKHDSRILAAANLDGWMFGSALRDGVKQPFLIMASDPYVELGDTPMPRLSTIVDEESFDRSDTALIVSGLHRRGGYFVSIAGFRHKDFTDSTFVPSLRFRNDGRIEPIHGYRIVSECVRTFFDHYLKHRSARLCDTGSARDGAVTISQFQSQSGSP